MHEKRKNPGLTELQKKIIRALQGDIPISERPFADIALTLNISEEDLLETVREFKEKKAIRRFGATLRHQKVGFSANAMSAWNVSPDQVEALGKTPCVPAAGYSLLRTPSRVGLAV